MGTKENVADLPSRGSFEFITDELKARKVDFKMPPFEVWVSVEKALENINRIPSGGEPSKSARGRGVAVRPAGMQDKA